MDICYFNNAATTYPKPEIVNKYIRNYLLNPPINSLRHCNCVKKSNDTDILCKREIKEFFNVDTDIYDIVITYGATHAANIAINNIKNLYKNNIQLITNSWCHNCIMRTHYGMIDNKPLIINNLKDINIDSEYYYVAITHENNVDGNIVDNDTIKTVIDKCRNYNIPIIIDITQSAGTFDIDITGYNYNNLYIICSCHKGLYSSQGIGFLIAPKKYLKHPLIYGGTGGIDSIDYKKTSSFEVGTQNELAMASLIGGFEYLNSLGSLNKIRFQKKTLTEYFIQNWNRLDSNIKKYLELNNCPVLESGIISLKILDKQRCLEIITKLTDTYRIILRSGVHCSPLYHINILNCESTLRLSFGKFNSLDQIDYFFKCLNEIIV